ncbi:glycosyltransferase involved in cell wall biosynthesis [Bacteroides zoogleoformans]|uniref:Glycosyltransferase family 1 protein n=1 Tax=Bacteroides zoogleoformans TaxID=28119 RepID=A0ABN5IHF0_9BACE|nr:glycosyltransferase family 1 protein [Bacteroides zoogleoformans]AVM52046.1 glycosyltransferase family 1 protein [Bacteroides zoogleoformans]TWJ13977.1 glycosyltransferase involved in cell wall biosynthesis [Bacteroides zoogleoformans]
MRIAIEAQRIFRCDKHGMDFVILEVLKELQSRKGDNEYFVFVAPGEDRCLHESANLHIIELKCPIYPLWEQIALPLAVRRLKVDMLHCTSNTAPLYSDVPIVLTLHDIIFLDKEKPGGMSRYQQLGRYYRRWNVPKIVGRCRHVITVSETECSNILKEFPMLENRLSVAYNGYSNQYRTLSKDETVSVTRKYIAEDEYLLFLGNTDPRKNTRGVLRSYHEYLNRSQRKMKLIVTGTEQAYVESMLIDMGIDSCAPNIIYTGYVPGEDLPALYNGAFTFLFPSIKEGFGIPILEAMACGTPVITGNASAMPEVAGPGAILVNPQKPQEITDALLRLETDNLFYKQQVHYGLKRVEQFSWKNTAEEYVKIYNDILVK